MSTASKGREVERASPRPMRTRSLRVASIGALLGLGAPFGLAVLAWLTGELAGLPRWIFVYSGASTVAVLTAFGAWLGARVDRKAHQALHDPLTGLANRRLLEASLPQQCARSGRDGRPISALMIDLDHFKRVNDQFGHRVGDRTLRAVAHAIEATTRGSDLVARYGGEEFVVLCPDTAPRAAAELAERLREAVQGLEATELGHPGPVTVSIGVFGGTGPTPTELLERADAAMYRAKEGGRNRVALDD